MNVPALITLVATALALVFLLLSLWNLRQVGKEEPSRLWRAVNEPRRYLASRKQSRRA